MLRSGSTITMEAWDMKYKPNSDWNHAWGAAPANIIPRFMWGIAPVEPGWAKATIKPLLSSLKQSEITVPTIRGNIQAEYTDNGESMEYIITIPANMDCEFIFAGKNIKDTIQGVSTILVDNIEINPVSGIINLKPGLNSIKIISQ